MATDRANGSLYTNINGKVATIEFGHPASNSFVAELLNRLIAEFHKLSENSDISVIVLKSEGDRAFCAGASFDELMAVSNLEEGKIFFSGFANVINAMRTCKKVIVGRVQGKTVGGGVGLASACDYVFASVDASVRLSELTIGIAPLVIEPAVERKIGAAAISELSLSPS
jgi:methylglutaconyl-CoA hydratase